MRKTIAAILLATAISTPALAKDRDRGRDDARVERAHKFEKRADRGRDRVERRADRAQARSSQRRAKVVRSAERRADRRAIERRAERRVAERRVERRVDERRAAAERAERRAETRLAERLRDRRAIQRQSIARARADARQERKVWKRVARDRQHSVAAARRMQNQRVRYEPVRIIQVVREAPRYRIARQPVYRAYEDDYRRYPAYDNHPAYAYAQEPYYPPYTSSGGGLLGGGMGDIASILLPVALSQFGLGDTLGLGSLSGLGGYGLADPAYGSGYAYPSYYEAGAMTYGYDQGLSSESSLVELAALALGSGYLGGDMLGLGSQGLI